MLTSFVIIGRLAGSHEGADGGGEGLGEAGDDAGAAIGGVGAALAGGVDVLKLEAFPQPGGNGLLAGDRERDTSGIYRGEQAS